MEIFLSEVGNYENVTYRMNSTNPDCPYVSFNGEEFLVNLAFLSYQEKDKKMLLHRYNIFKIIYGDLRELYEQNKLNEVIRFIGMVLNDRNFHISIISKNFLLARLAYVSIHGRNNYASRGNALLYISDMARMKEHFTYYLLDTCETHTTESFKKLLLKIRDEASYYIKDVSNVFKEDLTKLLWRKNYSTYAKSLYELYLDDSEEINQLATVMSLEPLVNRWNIDTEIPEFKINNIKFVHSDKYGYDPDIIKKFYLPYLPFEYIKIEKSEELKLLEDITYIIQKEITKAIEILKSNKNYKDDLHLLFVATLMNTITQSNFEFQIPINEWAGLISIMDLFTNDIGEFYKSTHVVDFLSLNYYKRTCDFLKNHPEDLNAARIFKIKIT